MVSEAAAPAPAVRDLLAVLLLCVGLAIAGFYNGPRFELPLLLWIAACAVIAVALVPAASVARRVAITVLVAMCWVLVSWRASVAPSLSLAPAWALLLVPMACFTAAGVGARAPLWIGATIVAGALLLIGVRDFAWATDQRPLGLLDPNNLASLTNMLWPPLFCLLLFGAGAPAGMLRPVCAAALALLASALLAIFDSRAGIGLGLAMMVLLLAVGLLRGRVSVALAGAGAWLAGLLLTGALAVGATAGEGRAQGEIAVSGTALADTGTSVALRLDMAKAAVGLWREAPVFGTGPQTFHLLYPAVRAPSEQHTAGNYAHNDWVQLLHEVSVPGVLALAGALLWFATAAVLSLAALARRDRDPGMAGDHARRLGLALGGGSLLVHALVNFSIYVVPLGLLLGIWLGLSLAGPGGIRRAPPNPAPVALLRLPAVLSALMLLPLGVDAVSASSLMGQPGLPLLAQWVPPQQRPALARTLHLLAPDDSVPAYFLAEQERRLAMTAAEPAQRDRHAALAVSWFETALARDPYNTEIHLPYADLLEALGGSIATPSGQTRTDLGLLQDMRALRPADLRPVNALGRRFYARGDAAAEQALLADWLRFCGLSARRDPDTTRVLVARAEQVLPGSPLLDDCPPGVRSGVGSAVASEARP